MRSFFTWVLAILCCSLLVACRPENPGTERDSGVGDTGAAIVDAAIVDAAPRIDAGDVCGDDVRGITEACEDGDAIPGDGCSATCTVEDGFRCPPAGGACRAIVCGDSIVETPERCDDGNADPDDGCSARCEVEAGWTCTIPGIACQAAMCGDGIIAGFEQCDDGGAIAPGCSADCHLEPGYHCPITGAACVATMCGDGMRQGTEQCDDGNARAYDGCDPECRNEPSCSGGVCTPVCGDGVILPGSTEECDDGNTAAGDGCSAICEEENGFDCTLAPEPLPDMLRLPVVYRDMRGIGQSGAPTHPDFDARDGVGITFDMVTDSLDAEKRPVFSGLVNGGAGALDASSFYDWYRDSARNTPVLDVLTLPRTGPAGSYRFASTDFFPIDGRGWNAPGSSAPETYFEPHNYGVTTEIRYWFEYEGSEALTFSGDDDLWVFVDGHLCLDVGGLHPPATAIMDFANPASDPDSRQVAIVTECRARLTVGRVYETTVFHAERRCCGSNFELTLSGFVTRVSSCEWMCGDGIVTRFELCDDGAEMNTGEYGHCGPDCRSRGPFCGDSTVAAGIETCDEGSDNNNGRYGGCNPDCTRGPHCGDGVPQAREECDAGEMNGRPGASCDASCRLTLR